MISVRSNISDTYFWLLVWLLLLPLENGEHAAALRDAVQPKVINNRTVGARQEAGQSNTYAHKKSNNNNVLRKGRLLWSF